MPPRLVARNGEQALPDTDCGTNGTIRALGRWKGLVRGSAHVHVQEVIAMIDPVTASNERLRETDRWGYTGAMVEDPVTVEETRGSNRLLWIALIAVALVVLIALFANPI
jgi:hypothetical protein